MILRDFTDLPLSPARQAHIYASGMLTIITLGTLALIAACFAALWLLVEMATLIFTAIVESCALIGQLYTSADPLVKFLILLSISYASYRLIRWRWLRAGRIGRRDV